MRTRDRLEELRRLAGLADGPRAALLPPEPSDDQLGRTHANYPELARMLEQAAAVRGWVRDIDRNTQLVRRLHADPAYHTNQQLQQQLDAAVTESNAAGLKVDGALRQLGEWAGRAGAAGRAGRVQLAGARSQFADALDRHHAALQAIRHDKHELLKAHIRLTNLTVSDEECESLLENDNIALFVDNVRAETAAARAALREAEARHGELRRVERSLRDVLQLFAQLQRHVAAQQDQLDRVEYYATQAGEAVGAGHHQLLKGSVSRAKTTKKKISLIICLVSGFLIVLMVLVLT